MSPLIKENFIDDPLENVELAASIQNWTFDRTDNEVSIIANGKHNNYQLSVSLQNDSNGLNVICGFDLRFNKKNKFQILKLVSSINAQLWLGHFDVWDKEGLIVYRNSSILEKSPNLKTIETLLNDAVSSIDLYFPAFQYILWAGKDSEEALQTVLFETRGEA
tara:strand:- start:7797 stop:8285 length:489 start_codon:yes stop_codon:yes gene_type:complete